MIAARIVTYGQDKWAPITASPVALTLPKRYEDTLKWDKIFVVVTVAGVPARILIKIEVFYSVQ